MSTRETAAAAPVLPADMHDAAGHTAAFAEMEAAARFHSVVTRGLTNARLEDYRELARLLGRRPFDGQAMRRHVHEVFEQRGHAHLLPGTSRDQAVLSASLATAQNEYMWQRRCWPEWEGREWDEAHDPTLAETVSAIAVGLEVHAVLEPTAASWAAVRLGDLCASARELERNGLVPVLSGRFAVALKTFAASLEGCSPQALAQRWLGVARSRGQPGKTALAAFEGAIQVVADMGLLPAIDRGWDRARGGGLAALDRIAALLEAASRPVVPAHLPEPAVRPAPRARASVLPIRQTPSHALAQARNPGEVSALGRSTRRPRVASVKGPGDIMSDGVQMLNAARPGTHVWFCGLAKVLAAAGAAVPDTGRLTVDMPDDGRAPYIWLHVAKRQGVEADLERAVLMAREILGLDVPAYARAM